MINGTEARRPSAAPRSSPSSITASSPCHRNARLHHTYRASRPASAATVLVGGAKEIRVGGEGSPRGRTGLLPPDGAVVGQWGRDHAEILGILATQRLGIAGAKEKPADAGNALHAALQGSDTERGSASDYARSSGEGIVPAVPCRHHRKPFARLVGSGGYIDLSSMLDGLRPWILPPFSAKASRSSVRWDPPPAQAGSTWYPQLRYSSTPRTMAAIDPDRSVP